MYTYQWYHWITFFYIYCFFGWIFESTYVSLKSGRFVNRGFLRLPMLPLYGTGAVMMLWVSLPFKDNLWMVYLSGVVAATILEYVTGYVMERLFKMKYWDYSNQPFQLHGYICLSSSVAWGFLTIFLTEVIHTPIQNAVLNLNPALEFTFLAIVSVLFVYDTVRSTKEALDLGRALEAMTKMKAELDEMQVQLALLKAETSQRVADMKEETAQRVAGMKEEAVHKVVDIKQETAQRMAGMREETAQKVADMKEGTALRIAEATQRFKERADGADILADKIQALTEKRQTISRQVSYYRKSILRGNPSASSRFADALKEYRETIGDGKKKKTK